MGQISSLFSDAPTEFNPSNAFCEVWGPTGTGRTTWAMHAPGPIAYFHCSEKTSFVLPQFSGSKRIKTFDFFGDFRADSNALSAMKASKKLDRLELAWDNALSWARTVIVDTHNSLWWLVRMAYFGALKPEEKKAAYRTWGPPNNRMFNLLSVARNQDKTNFIFIGEATPKWIETEKGSKRSDTILVRSTHYEKLITMCDFTARISVIRNGNKQTFRSTIEKFWGSKDVAGVFLEDSMSNFLDIAGMITETDWTE